MTTQLEMAEHRLERAHAMAEKYRAGATLQEIGDYYSVTRERVRQLMTEELGIARKDGGQSQRAKEKIRAARNRQDLRRIRKYGVTVAEYDLIQKHLDSTGASPLHRFSKQKLHAKNRGIEWMLNFAEWWSIWSVSGKWAERGRTGYVMARHGDTGPYAVGNIKIISAKENHSEYIRRYWKQVRSGDRPLPANCSKLREYSQCPPECPAR